MSDQPTIEEREDGPLVVKGLKTLTGTDGEAMEVKEVMALCRCGKSKMKPFCDGTHKEAGFKSRGGEPSGKDVVLTYEGDGLTLTYNPLLCSHAAHCVGHASGIFDPKRKPWADPHQGSKEDLMEILRACPSGALALKDGGHQFQEAAEITVAKNGPYQVQGASIDAAASGKGATEEKYVLCRCGLSGNKPYCDGTHYNKGWSDQD